jgi:predicted PolB exonuclease-like 3'-5' exonuclease
MEKYICFDLETTGLNACGHTITCICAKDEADNWFYEASTNEIEILLKFQDYLKKKKDYKLISANGKNFDIPFIFVRAYMLGIYINPLLFLGEHFDIVCDITDKWVSLNNLARIYCFELKTGSGSNAIKLFTEGKYGELLEYCSNDVKLTEKIYLKFQEIKKGVQNEYLGSKTEI